MTDTRRGFLATGATIVGVAVAGCLGDGTDEWTIDRTLSASTATQYQGPDCGCCDVYAEYLDDHLEAELDVVVTDDLAGVKREYGIESDLQSCHTVEIGGYVVEGHVPVEVIETVLEDGPDIEGIALPGMPPGSPGMGGEKDRTWTIYAIDSEETTTVYTEL